MKDGGLSTSVPVRLNLIAENYQLVIASKPGVPVIAEPADLNDRQCYVNDQGEYADEYLQRNHCNYYVDTHNELIRSLCQQNDYDEVIVMGHSQGATVAAKIAASNELVTRLIYLSGNPLGRFDESIRQKRQDAILGRISDEQAQTDIEELYRRWRTIMEDRESLDGSQGDSNKTWASFSEPTIDTLLGVSCPIFVGYELVTSQLPTATCCHWISADKVKPT